MRTMLFLKNSIASIAIFWGLALTAITPLIVLPYDYYNIIQKRNFLYNALDTASLGAIKDDTDINVIQTKINDYIDNIFTMHPSLSNEITISPVSVNTITADEQKGEWEYEFTLNATAETALMESFLGNAVNIQVKNSVVFRKRPTEVVLVLDASYSMNAKKFADMKYAAKRFVDGLLSQSENNDIRIGIVPYSGTVNIKTTTPDYLGNQHNWDISGSDKDIILSLVSTNQHLDNASKWATLRQTFRSFYTGNMWQYMDVEQHNPDVNGYYISGAIYNGDMDQNNTADTAFTAETDGVTYPIGYDPKQLARYRVDDDGDYVLYNASSHSIHGEITTPAPRSVTGALLDPDTPVPYGAHNEDDWGVNANVGTKTRRLPIWNNHFWINHLLFDPWKGCVLERYNPNQTDYELNDWPATAANPHSLYVPMIPLYTTQQYSSFKSWKHKDIPFGANLYGFMPNGGNFTPPETQDFLNGNLWHYPDISLYYLTHTLVWNNESAGTKRHFHRKQYSCPREPLMPLQTDATILNNYIDSLTTTFGTATSVGIKWGWNLLSPNTPFTAGSDYGETKKIMIVLTDGASYHGAGMGPYGVGHHPMGYDGAAITAPFNKNPSLRGWLNDKLLTICDNVKNVASGDDAIEIYTLAVMMRKNATDVMQQCSTSSDHFFDVQDSAMIDTALETIKNSISTTYISK